MSGTLTLYGLKTCDTCRKALKALAAAGREVVFVDVRSDGVPEAALTGWLQTHGIATLVNTRSTTWRGLDEDSRARISDLPGAAALLRAHPSLMKRPVITGDATSHVGWSKAVEAALT